MADAERSPIQVGDVVITYTETLATLSLLATGAASEPITGRPALVIAVGHTGYPHWWAHLRLKVGDVEWRDAARHYEKLSG
jgi:hypothetical protein